MKNQGVHFLKESAKRNKPDPDQGEEFPPKAAWFQDFTLALDPHHQTENLIPGNAGFRRLMRITDHGEAFFPYLTDSVQNIGPVASLIQDNIAFA